MSKLLNYEDIAVIERAIYIAVYYLEFLESERGTGKSFNKMLKEGEAECVEVALAAKKLGMNDPQFNV